MKAILKVFLVSAMLIMTGKATAQGWVIRKHPPPRWISGKGFWQIESNIKTPKNNTVYFYNHDRVLVYKEKVNNVMLDLSKKRVRMRLKKALEIAITAWNKEHAMQYDRQWLSALFK